MEEFINISITEQSLDVQKASDYVSNSENGAINLFIGVVRNNHQGRSVTGITYDAHETLAESELLTICREAKGTWPETRYYVSHYQGYLDVGGISVLIAVGAPHREDVFESCRYVIEEIKKRVPVWKQEHYTDGKSEWLPGHSLITETDSSIVCCGRCGGDE